MLLIQLATVLILVFSPVLSTNTELPKYWSNFQDRSIKNLISECPHTSQEIRSALLTWSSLTFNLDIMDYLLKNAPKLGIPVSKQFLLRVLLQAVYQNAIQAVGKIYKRFHDSLSENDWKMALHLAIEMGHEGLANGMLEANRLKEKYKLAGPRELRLAIEHQRVSVVEQILKPGSVTKGCIKLALPLASSLKSDAIFEALLEGTDISGLEGRLVNDAIIKDNHVRVKKLLYSKKITTPAMLEWACKEGESGPFDDLLQADLTQLAIRYSMKNGSWMELLIKFGPAVYSPAQRLRLLAVAWNWGREDLMGILMEESFEGYHEEFSELIEYFLRSDRHKDAVSKLDEAHRQEHEYPLRRDGMDDALVRMRTALMLEENIAAVFKEHQKHFMARPESITKVIEWAEEYDEYELLEWILLQDIDSRHPWWGSEHLRHATENGHEKFAVRLCKRFEPTVVFPWITNELVYEVATRNQADLLCCLVKHSTGVDVNMNHGQLAQNAFDWKSNELTEALIGKGAKIPKEHRDWFRYRGEYQMEGFLQWKWYQRLLKTNTEVDHLAALHALQSLDYNHYPNLAELITDFEFTRFPAALNFTLLNMLQKKKPLELICSLVKLRGNHAYIFWDGPQKAIFERAKTCTRRERKFNTYSATMEKFGLFAEEEGKKMLEARLEGVQEWILSFIEPKIEDQYWFVKDRILGFITSAKNMLKPAPIDKRTHVAMDGTRPKYSFKQNSKDLAMTVIGAILMTYFGHNVVYSAAENLFWVLLLAYSIALLQALFKKMR